MLEPCLSNASIRGSNLANAITNNRNRKQLSRRLSLYAKLVRLDRPIGIYLLLWPTLWALWWAAEGIPDLGVLVVFVLGTVIMRSAGCAINDFADRDFDGQVKRTKQRPLATGAVTPREAVGVFVTLALIAFLLVLTMNRLTIYLSIGGALLAFIYPFSKRHTYIPQVVLGAAFGWGIPMAWAAQTGELSRIAWLVYTAAVVWTVIYDTMYAMVDRDDDIKLGIKSTAILFGENDRLFIGILQALMLLTMIAIGIEMEMSVYYYASLLIGVGLFDHQLWLISEREPRDCFKAFLNNHWLGMIVFVGIVLHYLFAT